MAAAFTHGNPVISARRKRIRPDASFLLAFYEDNPGHGEPPTVLLSGEPRRPSMHRRSKGSWYFLSSN